jgi:hypothetical protein
MLPAQSTIPEGGFGNLIALPFQGKAQRKGNSVFVDEQFEPFPDQWLYLSQIQLIPHATVQNLIESIDNKPHGISAAVVGNTPRHILRGRESGFRSRRRTSRHRCPSRRPICSISPKNL